MPIYPGSYTYVVKFKKIIFDNIVAESKCYQVDKDHAERYARDIQSKNSEIFDIKIEEL